MNKTIALLILGVILLAMALIMVNQYVSQPEGVAMTPGGNAPMTVAPAQPQASSPQEALSQLEQRAAASELAPREAGSPVSPPMPQTMPQRPQPTPPTMPAWASNGGSSAAALTPPATGAAGGNAAEAVRDPAPAATPAKPAQARTEPAKPEAAKPEATKPAQAKPEASKPKPETAKPEAAKPEAAKPKPEAAKEQAKEQAKPKGPKTIKKIAVFRMDDEVAVRVEGSEAVTYKTMLLKSPDRLVVDLDGEWAIKAPGVPDNKFISNVRIGKQKDKTRIVIDLKQNPQNVRYVKRGAEGFDVRMK